MSTGRVSSSKKKRVNLVADFETTTDKNDCRVWLWGVASVDAPLDVEMGIDISSFLRRASKQNSVIYFHNLKFDGTFILDHLLRNGYVHVASGHGYMHFGEFSTLISQQTKFYSIKVKWRNGTITEFRDSAKKLPMTLSRVAKTFNMPEGKGTLDYKKFRAVGHQPTVMERDYMRRDVQILAQAMRTTLQQGMTKLTIGSDALHEYKEVFGQKMFTRMFPILPSTTDREIRRAYRGGFTYADPRYSGIRRNGSGLVLDVNSLYPYVMYDRDLPYGEPLYEEGKVTPTDTHPLTIFSITFTAKLKPRHIPCIQIKGSNMFTATEYLADIPEPVTLMVTNVDLELWQEHYDMDILSWDGGWKFKAVRGVFDDYIDKWSKIKAESTGGLRELAKLQLNSLYGKFASNPNVTGKIPVLKNNRVAYETGTEETRNPVYTAMGVYITAYARALTVRAAQANYDVFAYADTDSLHLLTDTVPAELEVHPTKLGAWKLEYHFVEAMYVRAKFYLEKKGDGEYVNRVAGLPTDISSQLTFDDIAVGAKFEGKLRPENVPGGVVLIDVPYELKA